jgi:hypothetical protein
MIFTIISVPNPTVFNNDVEQMFQHDVDIEDYVGSGSKCLQATFQYIERALNLDRKKFDYFIDWSNQSITVYTTRAKFTGNLRDTKLATLLDIEAL